MKREAILLMMLLLNAATALKAREIIDTLESTKRDRVILTYDLSQNGNSYVIRFLDVQKKLGRSSSEEYKKLEEVAVVYFDKTGNYDDRTVFTGINTEAFMVPSNVRYKRPRDGYYFIKDNPTIEVTLESEERAELRIPIFLAYYESKQRYKVFCRCGDLSIRLSKRSSSSPSSEVSTQTITTQEELESGLTEADEANILMNMVSDLLKDQDGPKFSSELSEAISRLRMLSYRIKEPAVSSKISEVLAACKQKEDELKERAEAEADAAAKAAERKAREAAEAEKALQDSIQAATQKQAEEDKKLNRWMIVGGVILAILGFAGNQFFQHIRNAKNQKSIHEMQEKAVRQAEDEAKRRARDFARTQNRHAGDTAKKAAKDIAKGKSTGKRNNGKEFSI